MHLIINPINPHLVGSRENYGFLIKKKKIWLNTRVSGPEKAAIEEAS